MNILAGRFPTSVEIGGREYALNTDYRIGLKCILAWEDQELTAREKTLVMLRLLYKEIPPDTQKACELAVYFLNCGEEKEGGSPGFSCPADLQLCEGCEVHLLRHPADAWD